MFRAFSALLCPCPACFSRPKKEARSRALRPLAMQVAVLVSSRYPRLSRLLAHRTRAPSPAEQPTSGDRDQSRPHEQLLESDQMSSSALPHDRTCKAGAESDREGGREAGGGSRELLLALGWLMGRGGVLCGDAEGAGVGGQTEEGRRRLKSEEGRGRLKSEEERGRLKSDRQTDRQTDRRTDE